MSEKKISTFEKKLYLFYTEDGFIDLAIGFVILLFGLSLMIDLPWIVGLVSMLPIMGWYIAKEKITSCRTGIINQNTSMKNRFSKFYLVLMVIGILVLALIISFIMNGSLILLQYPLSIIGLILALGISGLAIFLHTSRFYIHAGIIFIAMTIGENLNSCSNSIDLFILATIIASIVIICIGLLIAIRFLKKYPVFDKRNNN